MRGGGEEVSSSDIELYANYGCLHRLKEGKPTLQMAAQIIKIDEEVRLFAYQLIRTAVQMCLFPFARCCMALYIRCNRGIPLTKIKALFPCC